MPATNWKGDGAGGLYGRCRQCNDDGFACDACGVPAQFVPQNAASRYDWSPLLWRRPTWLRVGPGAIAPGAEPPPAVEDFTADEIADVLAVIDRAAAATIASLAPTAAERETAADTDAGFAAYEAEVAAERDRRNAEDRWVDAPPPGWDWDLWRP